jgi:hypothetical protein
MEVGFQSSEVIEVGVEMRESSAGSSMSALIDGKYGGSIGNQVIGYMRITLPMLSKTMHDPKDISWCDRLGTPPSHHDLDGLLLLSERVLRNVKIVNFHPLFSPSILRSIRSD